MKTGPNRLRKKIGKWSLLWILVALFSGNTGFSQGTGLGGSVSYNFQTEGIGFGLRYGIYMGKRFTAMPQVTFYPGFNQIKETYYTLNLHYNALIYQNFVVYAIAGGSYNAWHNYYDFKNHLSNSSTVIGEVGIGATKNVGCLRLFIEHRYNFMWKEGELQAGLMFHFKSCGKGKGGRGGRGGYGGRGGRGGKKRGAVPCPAYQ